MPNPKRRHSKTRRDKRRSHDFLTPVRTINCTNCGTPVRPHRVCSGCGFYKGKQIISIKTSA